MKKTILFLLVIILIGVGIFVFEKRSETTMYQGEKVTLGPLETGFQIEVGQKAPDFMLTDYSDELHQLSDYRGKYVVLNFWATWCPFCVEEMPLFEHYYADFKAQGGEIIAVNRGESLEQAKKFTDPMELSYQLLMNSADDVAAAYQVRAMPTTLFIDKKGVIQDIVRGPLTEFSFKKKLDELMSQPAENPQEVDEPQKAVRDSSVEKSKRPISLTDGVKHSVPLSDILSGGPPKDGIPPIDHPSFTSIAEADTFLEPNGLGIAVSFNEIERFYPFQILVWHEIVNDNLGDQPIVVTYCPLCGTGIVFEPIVDGQQTTFGTSGKLWNSNLVMYDRATDTYWSQVLGEAIVGKHTGTKLKLLAHDNVRWKDWKKAHPKGQVLSKDTGHIRDYNRSPYGDYDTNEAVFFPVDHDDSRYHEKEPVWGIVIDAQAKAYPQSELLKGKAQFTDTFAGVPLSVTFNKGDRTIKIVRTDTDAEVVPFFGFWFSWIAVWPDSEVMTF